MPAKVDSIIASIRNSGKEKKSQSQAIAIAKDRGLIKQDGDKLVLTEKGRNANGSKQ